MHDLKGRSANDPLIVRKEHVIRARGETAHIHPDHAWIHLEKADLGSPAKRIHDHIPKPIPVKRMRKFHPKFPLRRVGEYL